MSIASEITRINDAKTSIKNSIINKGITVLDTQKIDEYSTLIDSIETKKPEQSKSATPSESVQNIAPDSGYTLSQVTVEAISKTYVGSNVTKKSAQTYTPTTTDQTIASGQYLTGTQTIKGDSNLTADNIKSGTSIFGVTGTYEGSSPNLQSKSVTYTSNGTATITPEAGYDGLSSVDVTVDVASGGGTSTVTFTRDGGLGARIYYLDLDGVWKNEGLTASVTTITIRQYSPFILNSMYMTYGLSNVNNIKEATIDGSIVINNKTSKIYYATASIASATLPSD